MKVFFMRLLNTGGPISALNLSNSDVIYTVCAIFIAQFLRARLSEVRSLVETDKEQTPLFNALFKYLSAAIKSFAKLLDI